MPVKDGYIMQPVLTLNPELTAGLTMTAGSNSEPGMTVLFSNNHIRQPRHRRKQKLKFYTMTNTSILPLSVTTMNLKK